MKTGFFHYYTGTLIRPYRTFTELAGEPGKLRYSLTAVSVTAIVYTFVYIFLIFGDGRPFSPWLNIPPEVYYRYNVIFCAPSMFLGWILASAVVQFISRSMSSQGDFEQSLAVTGFGLSMASWSTGIHDLISSFLGAIHVINQQEFEHALNSPTIWRTILWILMIAYLSWFILLFSKGYKAIYHIKTWQSVILGTVGFITYQLFFFIFNR